MIFLSKRFVSLFAFLFFSMGGILFSLVYFYGKKEPKSCSDVLIDPSKLHTMQFLRKDKSNKRRFFIIDSIDMHLGASRELLYLKLSPKQYETIFEILKNDNVVKYNKNIEEWGTTVCFIEILISAPSSESNENKVLIQSIEISDNDLFYKVYNKNLHDKSFLFYHPGLLDMIQDKLDI